MFPLWNLNVKKHSLITGAIIHGGKTLCDPLFKIRNHKKMGSKIYVHFHKEIFTVKLEYENHYYNLTVCLQQHKNHQFFKLRSNRLIEIPFQKFKLSKLNITLVHKYRKRIYGVL